MDLGPTIVRLRKERGLKAKDVAKKAGISFNAISAIEKGRSFPTKKTFYAICNAIGMPHYLVLAECLTIDDVAPEKREFFKVIWPPIMDFLRK